MSGIYIKGMEMPKSCFLCKLSYLAGERLYCNVTYEEVLRAKIAQECPLVAVPDHGRLIDADALIKLLDNCMFPSDMVTTQAVSMARNWLMDAPTIIESEE